jgi:Ala-tRNA(Pro) deacylase
MNSPEDVLAYLDKLGIEYKMHEHVAVFTAEEAAEHTSHIKGLACKNLLLNDQKKRHFYLVVLPAKKSVNLKSLFPKIKLSFSSPKRVQEKLGLLPGSVSPFGLINNTEKDVKLYIDKDVYEADFVTFHPNLNTATLLLSKVDFHKFLKTLENDMVII